MQTFAPSKSPNYSIQSTITPKVKILQFGNGYTQRTQDGINNKEKKHRLQFGLLTNAEYIDFLNFFNQHGGHTAFKYQIPNLDTAQKNYIFDSSIVVSQPMFQRFKIDVTLKEVYDIA